MAARAIMLIGLVMQITASAQPSSLLQIVREPLKPDTEAAFNAIEEERARLAAMLGCPHPYLGAESITGPKEAWWFNAYQSATEQQQVYDAYANNAPLMAAFQKSAQPKAALTLTSIEVFASYKPDRSKGAPWTLGQGRYLVITRIDRTAGPVGTVFEATDGTQLRRKDGRNPRRSGGDEASRWAGHHGPRYPPIMELSGGRMDCSRPGILASESGCSPLSGLTD